MGYLRIPAVAVAGTDYAEVGPGVVEEVGIPAVYTLADHAVSLDIAMDQLIGLAVDIEDKKCTHSAELMEHIDSRIHMADIAVVACIADADIGVVAVPALVERNKLADHPRCDHIIRLLGRACLAFQLASLFISTYQSLRKRNSRCLVCFSSAFLCSFPPTAYACSYNT